MCLQKNIKPIKQVGIYFIHLKTYYINRYFKKNFITSSPTKKLVITPKKNGTLNTKSLNFSTVAANTIGVDNKKEYLDFLNDFWGLYLSKIK